METKSASILTTSAEINAKEKQPEKDVFEQRKTEEIISNSKLLESGIYFGHKKEFWNPKMKPYILTTRKNAHIIDIKKTKKTLEFAYNIIYKYAKEGATFVFVGTRKQAKKTIRENALRVNSHYVAERWLGGTLTNSRTIFKRVNHMLRLEKLALENYKDYTKKEGLLLERELTKLQKNLTGIKEMRQKPNFMIVADPLKDAIAVREAHKTGIKVISIVDTNADPTLVDIAIPANDDSIKSVTLIITILADAIAEAKGGKIKYAYQTDENVELPEDKKREQPRYRSSGSNYNNQDRSYNSDRGGYNSERGGGYNNQDRRPFNPRRLLEKKNLDELKVYELKSLAQASGVPGFEKLSKEKLVEALRPLVNQDKAK